jgi:hypothetical protein
VITVTELKSRTVKDLATLAKRKGVCGWHAMRKEELIQALVKHLKAEASKKPIISNHNGCALSKNGHSSKNGYKANGRGENGDKSSKNEVKVNGSNGHALTKPRSPRIERRLRQIKAQLSQSVDLSNTELLGGDAESHDRLVVMVRDPYWLHAYWELTRASVERARAALAQYWHGARPILRLAEVSHDGTTSNVRKILRDIEIHGGVSNWYIDVPEPPKSFQVEIGYLALDGHFVCLARSNVVTTPSADAALGLDRNWADVADDCDHIYAMSGGEEEECSDLKNIFEERLRRPLGGSLASRCGLVAGVASLQHPRDFCFEVNAELVVYGMANPDARVTFRGEPVRLQPDGSFAMRFNFPDRRQVLPVVASSSDGVEQRTIVLAVERNTKVMEPVIREADA